MHKLAKANKRVFWLVQEYVPMNHFDLWQRISLHNVASQAALSRNGNGVRYLHTSAYFQKLK